jgi:hypothetical protein
MKVSNWSFIALLILACSPKKENCAIDTFADLSLYPVNTNLRLPPYKIVDSLKYGNGETILNYKIKAIDSTVELIAFIYDYTKKSDREFDMVHFSSVQKEEVKFGRDSVAILIDTVKDFGEVKVGYLKYLIEQKGKKFFEGRIFFYKENKLSIIWLFEPYREDRASKLSTIDCIFESMQIN